MHESILAMQPSDIGATHLSHMQREESRHQDQSHLHLPGGVYHPALKLRNPSIRDLTRNGRRMFASSITVHDSICYPKRIQFSNNDIAGKRMLTQSAAESPCALHVGVPFGSHANGIASPLRPSSPQSLPNESGFFRIDQSQRQLSAS